jgi:HK97 family phage major capsid protein
MIELLKDLIRSKMLLLEATEDAEKQKEISKEIMELQKQLGRAELEAEQKAQKAAKDAETKAQAKANTAAAKTIPEPKMAEGDKIEVGQGIWQGKHFSRSLRAETRGLTHGGIINPKMEDYYRQNPKAAEKMCIFFLEMVDRSFGNPMNRAGIKAAMQEGTTTEGGYLVRDEIRDELAAYARMESIALQNCMVIPMNTDTMLVNAENAKVTVAITAEETDATEAEPTIAQTTLTAKRYDAFSIVSNELINDATLPGGFSALLLSQFMEAVGQKVDSAVFIGTGDPCSGVFLSTGYSEVFSSTSTAFSELLESNLRNVIADIAPSNRRGAKFYTATSNLWTYIMGLQDSQGRPLFFESRTGGPIPGKLLGYPVVEGDDSIMPSTSAVETGFIVFGDLKGFYIGERMGNVDLLVDPYSVGKSYRTQFYFFTRWATAHVLNKYYSRIVTAAS